MKKLISLLLSVLIVLSCFVSAFAERVFQGDAIATVITASDFQAEGNEAFDRFANILTLMKNSGLSDPDSALIGGDYSKIWPDYATPGVVKVKEAYTSVFPQEDENSVICIQGNHDFVSSGFTKTGLYDMGTYSLYVINENDFQWNQFLRLKAPAKAFADKVSTNLDKLIQSGDKRPVLIVTHVPLHFSSRTGYGDNMHSAYLFKAINEAAKKLDIVFLFGHNHSGAYDDYIGGSVNFLARGEEILIPDPDKRGEDCCTKETLNFTYTNCGYVGYSDNGTDNGSTNKLTVGAIQISENNIRFIRYSEEGVMGVNDVERIAPSSAVKTLSGYPQTFSEYLYKIIKAIVLWFENIFQAK